MKHPKPWTAENTLPLVPRKGFESGMWSIKDANGKPFCAMFDESTALEIVRCVNAHEALVERVDGLERALLESLRYSDAEVRGISVVPKSAMSLRHYCNKFALTLAKETT